jgi:hypothetical protein
MGKLFAFVFVLCAVVGAALFVPVGGRTFWSRAVERGIPQAVARNVAHGLRSGWDWVMADRQTDKPARPVRRAIPARAVAKAAPVRAAPARPSPAPAARVAVAPPPSPAATRVASAPNGSVTAVPRPTRDGIVAQPKEKLHDDDRRELDRLVATQR